MSVNEFRAADAERLLNDPLIKEALAAIKAEIIEQLLPVGKSGTSQYLSKVAKGK